MAAAAILKNLTRLEVVFSGQTVVIKSNRKSDTATMFMRFPPYFYFRFHVRASRASFIAFLQSLVLDIASLDRYGRV